ncbi:MAG TPA: hypothetical protein VFK06_24515 [Candidatus Angelobacter sp.]|nr:hypothetical protein [Candidatus Angelobacter sp.]
MIFTAEEDTATATFSIAWRIHLRELSAAITQHVGPHPSACWYPYRSSWYPQHSLQSPATSQPLDDNTPILALYIGGSKTTLALHFVPCDERCTYPILPNPVEISTGTAVCRVIDFVDAFYLSMYLFDVLGIKPAVDLDHIIVPGNLRRALGLKSLTNPAYYKEQ